MKNLDMENERTRNSSPKDDSINERKKKGIPRKNENNN
jgi:hypothetical protein